VLFYLFPISRKFVSLRGSFFSYWLRGYKSIVQNKPNSINPRIAAIPYTTSIYNKILLRRPHKNKAKQSQSHPTTQYGNGHPKPTILP